ASSTPARGRARRWALSVAALAAVATAVAMPQVVPAAPVAAQAGPAVEPAIQTIPGAQPSQPQPIIGAIGQTVAANFVGEDSAGGLVAPSLWWSWTAPAAGTYRFSTHGSEFDTVLRLHTAGTEQDPPTLV